MHGEGAIMRARGHYKNLTHVGARRADPARGFTVTMAVSRKGRGMQGEKQ
jgi:hypothetical protein